MPSIAINLHLGDNANFRFEGATFCGLRVDLPLTLRNTSDGDPTLVIYTSAIETLADWQAHRVSLNGSVLGVLKDKNVEPNELHRFTMPRALLVSEKVRLSIEVGAQSPSLVDDFVLVKLAAEGAELGYGWA